MRHDLRLMLLLLSASLGVLGPAGCGDRSDVGAGTKSAAPASVPAPSAATLADGIVFSKPALPDFIAKTEGFAQPEPFGRWTDGPKASIEFKDALPKQFDLVVTGAAFGPNVGQPVKITIGSVTQEVSFSSEMSKGADTRRLSYTLAQPANRIEFLIPHPTRPPNSDIRELGIALVSLKIEAGGK